LLQQQAYNAKRFKATKLRGHSAEDNSALAKATDYLSPYSR